MKNGDYKRMSSFDTYMHLHFCFYKIGSWSTLCFATFIVIPSCEIFSDSIINLLNSTKSYTVTQLVQYYWRCGASMVAQMVKNLPEMQDTWVQFLGQEDPLEKGMATHSSILAQGNSWTEEPGGLQSMGSQRVGRFWTTNIEDVGCLNLRLHKNLCVTHSSG